MSYDSLRELTDFIFHHFGEASPGVQAALFKWKKDHEEVEALAKARAKPSSSSKKKSKASLKVGPTAKRLKASPGSPKPTSRSEEPETHSQILTPSSVDVASGNINYAAVAAGTSHETAASKRGAASTDLRFSAGTSQSAKAAGNLATVGNKATTPRGATSNDLRISAGTSHAANVSGNLDTVSEYVTAAQGATRRDPRAKAGMGAAVNSVVTRASAGQ